MVLGVALLLQAVDPNGSEAPQPDHRLSALTRLSPHRETSEVTATTICVIIGAVPPEQRRRGGIREMDEFSVCVCVFV